MKHLSLDEEQVIYDEIGIAANHLRHLPFAGLRKTATHQFGCLRLWPKLKSFREEVSWETLQFRPLVSFRKHQWRRVLALLSKW